MEKYRDKETGSIIVENESNSELEKVKNLCVCNSCLAAIESHEGRQLYRKHYIDGVIICDWCEMEIYNEINELI